MATTSIWRVGGRLGKIIDYAENPEKTTNPSAANPAASPGCERDLSDVINYAMQQRKTVKESGDEEQPVMLRFVSGVNCHPDTAGEEMLMVKRRFGKEGGTLAYHGYQSFAPGEATPELAHEIGIKLAQRLWGDRYQVLVATHLDKANHLHSHFVVNTVSFVDGIKYRRTKQDYKEMQRVSDALCREYNLSVIRNPKGRGKHYGEWKAEQQGRPTLRSVIRSDIDRAILASTTQRNFQEALQAMGYTFKTRTPDGQLLKYPALKPPGAKGYFRFHRLGPGYSLTEILDRVYDNVRRQTPFPEADRMAKHHTPFIPYPKAKGIHALYLRYCYELHIIQKHPASVKRVPFSMRQDLILLDKLDAETRFLAKHEYGTAAELETHKEKSTGRISELEQERNALRNQLRTATRREDAPGIDGLKNRIKEVSSEIKALRQEVKLCDGIEARSALMERNLEQLQQEQEIERKEEEQHELFRRGGRSGRPFESERR